MASTGDWFETVAEARRRARRRLPRSVFLALEAGAEAGVTRADNVAAFGELRFAPPRVADLPAARDLRTSVLGTDIDLPARRQCTRSAKSPSPRAPAPPGPRWG